MSERAARWLRVSSDKQDEENQAARLDSHMARYEDSGISYEVHAGSAFKGEHRAELERALADMAAGKFTVLVARHSDRIDREDKLRDWLMQAAAAGGRFDFVDDPSSAQLGADLGSKISVLIASHGNNEYSRKISRNVRDAHARIRADGAFIGRAPWGYVTEGPKYSKTIVPTTEGRRLIPEVYARVIAGDSLSTVARFLKAETGREWWPRTIGTMIRNPVYRGIVQDGTGRVVHRCEPVVDARVWRLAGESLDSRPKRGPANAENRALLAGILFCGRCAGNGVDSPMYRVVAGKAGNRRVYYRCSGRGASRKGCGLLLPVATVDGLTGICIKHHGRDLDIMETTLVPGTDHAAELDEIRFEIKALDPEALTDDEYDGRLRDLRAERDRLASLPTVPDSIQSRSTGETYEYKWKRLGAQERGAWLRARGITVRVDKGGAGYHIVVIDAQGERLIEYVSPEHIMTDEFTDIEGEA